MLKLLKLHAPSQAIPELRRWFTEGPSTSLLHRILNTQQIAFARFFVKANMLGQSMQSGKLGLGIGSAYPPPPPPCSVSS